MGKWIIALVACVVVGGCAGGYKVDSKVLDAVATIKGADDYEYYDHEGAYVVGNRRVVVGWWGGRAYGREYVDGVKKELTATDAAALLAAFELMAFDVTARFESLKN